ncbi:MAG: hypothetical protein EOP55_09970 [Sphingobacteriales bacterium]|nr:MAG: hypothetical protein EOP55_09970 [Sphingobacteriales bacterium]
MTRYEVITGLGDQLGLLMAKSLIPVHILDWKVYYETYLNEAAKYKLLHGKTGKTYVAGLVADEYNLSERTVFSIIAFMEGC